MPSEQPFPWQSLTRGCLLLTGVAVLLTLAIFVWLSLQGQVSRMGAVLVAAGVCWVAVVGGLLVSLFASRGGQPIAGVLGGILIRFGVPLGVGQALQATQSTLAAQGVFSFILLYYLTLLPLETWLSLPPAGKSGQRLAASKGE